MWGTLIQEKSEFGRYLTRRSSRVDSSEPTLQLDRIDNPELRNAILGLTSTDAQRRGIGKSIGPYVKDHEGEIKRN
jgi:hypothetical protein